MKHFACKGVVNTPAKVRLQIKSFISVWLNCSFFVISFLHVNIEYCNKSNCIKYLFKYINKGVDCVTATLRNRDQETVDEIQQYYDCRFLSPSESIWRIFAFQIHNRNPAVIRLTFHEEGKQSIVFKDSSDL
jgi:hypothetical protein